MRTNAIAAGLLGLASLATISLAHADIDKGLEALKGQDFETAAKEFAASAEAGEADGGFYLARMYELGVGTDANVPTAIQLYKFSAEKGSPKAQNRLGMLHLQGTGVLQDYAEAAKYFEQAATGKDSQAGDANAQFNLAALYAQGTGVEQSDQTAFEWYLKAAKQDHIASQNSVALAYKNGKGTAVDSQKAVEWFKKVAAVGNPLGLFELGNAYETANGVAQDLVKAHMYYNLAAARNHPTAATERDRLAQDMETAQINAAQKQAREWQAATPEERAKR